MKACIRVGGVRLDAFFDTSGIKHSTILRRDDFSGDYQSSCSFAAPPGFAAPWFVEGAEYEVVRGGCVEWCGPVDELTPPTSGGDQWSIHANGWGVQAQEYDALVLSGSDWVPTGVPNDAADGAITRTGWPVVRIGDFGGSAITDNDSEAGSLSELLTRGAQKLGKRWGVNTSKQLVTYDEPTVPKFVVSPGDAYLGTVDSEVVTVLRGIYVSAVNGDGLPVSWAYAQRPLEADVATDPAVLKFDYHERFVDLTALGAMSAPAAQANIDGRYDLVAGRTGWTNTVTMNSLNVRMMGAGWVDPTMVKAGDMVRVPGVSDSRSSVTARGSIDLVMAEVEHDEDSGESVGAPLGFVPRDFAGGLAAAQSPTQSTEAA